ncbi:hypothetical protein A3C32_02750 [Candidatus Daviesbacteria bacterium RIFCSPHIGHO2_02_FULL_41_14]|nr:MAG: hypothetical protein A3C32_02750 [Candidatus Daviesbacteria bacterium RIFCSPHIGHO2_02_FULL_41_14]
MKILSTITQADIFPGQISTPAKQMGELRQAVRVVLLDKDGKVALGFYPPKENYPNEEYELPGGGVDEGESITDALARECLEEVGCKIKDVKELGVIKESGVGKNIKHDQDTYCFMALVDGEKGEPQYTEREKQDLCEVRWMPLNEAFEKISNQEPGFSRSRSMICLNEVRTNKPLSR